MDNTTKLTMCLAAVAGLALSVAPVNAATVIIISAPFSGSFTEDNNPADQVYTGEVSTVDLLDELTATTATGWNNANGAHSDELNDGRYGDTSVVDAGGAWTNEGAVVEYNLGPNALGYDITGIKSIASWNGAGFGNQVWTVEVKAVGGSYALLASVEYTPFNNNVGGSSMVDLTGLNATGIESIRFTAGSTQDEVSEDKSVGNDFVWREIDVFGIATVPEPSSTTLLGLGAMAIALRRRRV